MSKRKYHITNKNTVTKVKSFILEIFIEFTFHVNMNKVCFIHKYLNYYRCCLNSTLARFVFQQIGNLSSLVRAARFFRIAFMGTINAFKFQSRCILFRLLCHNDIENTLLYEIVKTPKQPLPGFKSTFNQIAIDRHDYSFRYSNNHLIT